MIRIVILCLFLLNCISCASTTTGTSRDTIVNIPSKDVDLTVEVEIKIPTKIVPPHNTEGNMESK